MSTKNSYDVNNHNETATWVPMSFIEGAIQGLRTIGSETAYWFPFTSASKNDTTHDEPNVPEDTNIIYYALPEQQSFKAGTEFLRLLREKIEDQNFDPKEKLPPCFYEAVAHKVFLKKNFVTKDHPEPETLGKTKADKVKIKTDKFEPFTELNNQKLKTYGDVLKIKNIERYLEEKRVEATENIMVHSLLKESAKLRTAVVCQHLPETRPITLVMPVHLGGHYHTYAARIDENNSVELLKISTLRGYPDDVVIDGMKAGIMEALGIDKKKIAKPIQAFANQGDGVSCGPISTTVSLQVNPNIPLSLQVEHLENAIACYRRNRSIVKKALAEVYYSFAGIRLNDEKKSKKLPKASTIRSETAKYVGFFNKARPCTFNIHVQQGDECAIYGARIGEDSCELICSSSFEDEYNERVLNAIKAGIKNVLSVGDDFFEEPIQSDQIDTSETTVVSGRLDPKHEFLDKYLSNELAAPKLRVSDCKAYRKSLNEDETLSLIQEETVGYAALLQNVRPIAFGIHVQQGDESAIYGIRIVNEVCELICISSLPEAFDEKALAVIKNQIKNTLSVDDDFFSEPVFSDQNISDKLTIIPTVKEISQHKLLADQTDYLNLLVLDSRINRKELEDDQCETTYCFRSPALTTEQILAKRDSWEQHFNAQLAHIPPPEPKKKVDLRSKAKTTSPLRASIEQVLRASSGSLKISKDLTDELVIAIKSKFDKTSARLPMAKRLALAINATSKEKKVTPEKRAIQFAAADLLLALYQQQQKDKEHHLKVAIAMSVVGIILPFISHALIWIIYSALHRNDVIKLTFNREDYEKFKQEDKPNFSIENRVNNYDKMPLKKRTNKKNNTKSYFFRSVYTDEDDVNGKPSDQFSILLLDKKKAAQLQDEFDQWEEKHQFEVAASG